MALSVYRTVIGPVVMYTAETERITAGERKILRIYEPKLDAGIWRIRNNRKLYAINAKPQIIGEIKSSRLSWAGHVEWSEKNSLIRRVYVGKPGDRDEDVAEDIKEIDRDERTVTPK